MNLVTQQIRGLKTGWLQNSTTSSISSSAPIVIFLHGFPDSPYHWRAQMEALSRSTVVVAPFLRGIGASESNKNSGSRYSLDAFNLDSFEMLRKIDPESKRSVFIVGHDIGSLYAWSLARVLGERLKGLVIINGAAPEQMLSRLKNLGQVKKSWYIAAFQVPFLSEKVFRITGQKLVAKQRSKEGLSYNEISEQTIHEFLKHYRSLARSSLATLVKKQKKIFAPVLLLSGKDDPYLLPPTSSEVEALSVQPVIRVVEGGHWIHEQRSDYINQKLKEFIGEHS